MKFLRTIRNFFKCHNFSLYEHFVSITYMATCIIEYVSAVYIRIY